MDVILKLQASCPWRASSRDCPLRPKGRAAVAVLLSLWLLLLLPLPLVSATASSQVAKKADYLAGMLEFVRWEIRQAEGWTIGVLGAEGVYEELCRIRDGSRLSGKQIEVLRLEELSSAAEVDLLFVGAGNQHIWDSVLALSRRASVLSVGEEPGFIEAGGLVEFVPQRDRLRFSLDREAALRRGIAISSILAQLAIERPR